jgi:hypothetical protein
MAPRAAIRMLHFDVPFWPRQFARFWPLSAILEADSRVI